MYRVLLVDDDMIVQMFLKDAFHWEQYGFEVVGEARDGEEALYQVKRLEPDLVLTDISMPRINGIALIQRLRSEQAFDGAIIALSCYDDPALIQNAMQSGADEYLLKNHLSQKSLDAMMQKIIERVTARRPEPGKQPASAAPMRREYETARRELLEYILSGEVHKTDLPQKLQNAGLSGRYLRAAALLVQPSGADTGQIHALLDLSSRRVLDERCVFFHSASGFFALLADFTDVPSTLDALDLLHQWEDFIEGIATQYLNLPVGFYMSAICEGADAVVDAFRQAHEMLPYGFYGLGRWQYGNEPPLHDTWPSEAACFVQNLPEMLRNTPAQLEPAYQQALEAFRTYKVHPGIVLSWLRRCDRAAGITRSEAEYSRLNHWELYAPLAQAYLSRQHISVPPTVGPTIRTVVQYLHEHYREPIGLGHAARHAGLSSAYLSSLFKQEMGISFSKYLLQLRMEQVQERLVSTTQTIKLIAADAGFLDYQHFCKTFKRMTGISPTEYRERNCR